LVDYSYNHPTPRAIRDAGYLGAMRYLSFDGPPKNLAANERDALHAAGLGIGLVWETTANAALGGAQRGLSDASNANSQADHLGYPPGLPIFYAVDFEAYNGAPMDAVADYFRGLGLASPTRPVGAYGCYAVIEHLGLLKLATHSWQCVAWSHNHRSPRADLFQRYGYVLGDTCDENDILTDPDWLWYPPGSSNAHPKDDMAALTPEIKEAFAELANGTVTVVVRSVNETAERVIALLDERGDSEAVTAATAVIGHIDAGHPEAARKVAIDLVNRLAPAGSDNPI
jgi:hypothetical protein